MAAQFGNRFKTALQGGGRLQGAWSMSNSPTVVEALGHVGADYVVLDLEHSPTSIHGMLPLLMAADAAGCPPVVRMPDHSRTNVKHALDLGANSLMFPFVETAEEARALVDACLYPPHGRRGFSRLNRASRYLADAGYLDRAKDDVLVVPQLESEAAVGRLEEIATVPGVGAIFIGPGDLAASLGLLGQVTHARVKEMLADCGRRASKLGVPIGTVLPDAEQAAWAFQQGYSFVAVGNDLASIVTTGRKAQADLRALREKAGG
ncbi:MAG TPA: aldolase/citrate lyase family protein [Azospirillaceae bacterium]|nr:aldolase/citrate lyase family protein [Azospirillaceae bacterium]